MPVFYMSIICRERLEHFPLIIEEESLYRSLAHYRVVVNGYRIDSGCHFYDGKFQIRYFPESRFPVISDSFLPLSVPVSISSRR